MGYGPCFRDEYGRCGNCISNFYPDKQAIIACRMEIITWRKKGGRSDADRDSGGPIPSIKILSVFICD
jgi:hypothetical protein